MAFTGAPIAVAQDGKPTIQDFKFAPDRERYGDNLKYTFSYQNFSGELAAVKDVEMWLVWLAPGHNYVRSRYVPMAEELAKHTAESGIFESRELRWLPPQKDPPGSKVDVEYTLQSKLSSGKKMKVTAKLFQSHGFLSASGTPPRALKIVSSASL